METTTLQTGEIADLEQELLASLPLATLSLSSAEITECTCPEWCERDHDRD